MNITDKVFVYIQTINLKKTKESISLDLRRRLDGVQMDGEGEGKLLINSVRGKQEL